MINFERKEHYGLSDLLRIVALLRSEDGCPWDRVQTHASLRRSLLEEAYEAAEAIDREDPALLKEELGDLLLQVVFHADIERQAGDFTMDDVADGSVQQNAGDGNTQGSPFGRFAWPCVFSSPAFNSLPVGKLTSKITLPLTKQDRKSN